jgi:hypothetical protein
VDAPNRIDLLETSPVTQRSILQVFTNCLGVGNVSARTSGNSSVRKFLRRSS